MSTETALQKIEHPESESAVVPYHPLPPPSVFGTADPIEVIEKATRVAAALKQVVVSSGLISKISGKEYPRCEAWTLLGTMLGIFPVTVWTKPIEGGWEARTEARTLNGTVVGTAEAMCLRSERNWANRDDFALRSMAATRSVAKALRMPLGFVMSLSGFQPTPAEEMDFEREPKQPERKPANVPRDTKPKEPPKATDKTRAWFLAEMRKHFSDPTLLQWGCDDGPPFALMPNEKLEDWHLDQVPTTKEALREKIERCGQFMGVSPQEQPKTAQDDLKGAVGASSAQNASQTAKRAPSTPPGESEDHHQAEWY